MSLAPYHLDRFSNSAATTGLRYTCLLGTIVTTPLARIGLPLAMTPALALATKRTTAKSLLVRILVSRRTMADASVVCTNKADAHPKRHECRYITQGTFTTS